MKDKMKNTLSHEVELLGRSISVLAIAGLLVVGGASAALLNSFGEITGDADVDQAVYLEDAAGDAVTDEDTIQASYDTEFVAGQTFNDQFEAVNDADSPVEVEFASTGENTDVIADNPSEGVVQNVYEVQEFGLYEANNDDRSVPEDDSEVDDDASHYITVEPEVDAVSYRFDEGSDNVEFVVSPNAEDSEDNLEVGRDGETDSDWYFDNKESGDRTTYDSKSNLVAEEEAVRHLDVDDGNVEITVVKDVGTDQAVQVSTRGGSETRYFTDGFVGEYGSDDPFPGQSTDKMVTVDTTDQIGSSFDLGVEGQDYVLSTHFPVNLQPSNSYDFGVELDLAAE